ncbi:MAG: DUF6691 family protein [Myxococcota bacterium]
MTSQTWIAFFLGALFAVGLALGGMTDPAKVRGFLDFAGSWDPSLMFVMAGGVGVYTAFFRAVRPRMSRPVLASTFQIPTRKDLDARLLGGAALFGVGWGLGGICPGPALAVASVSGSGGLIFIGAMILGMMLVPKR